RGTWSPRVCAVFACSQDFDRSVALVEQAGGAIDALARRPGGGRLKKYLEPPTPTADGPRYLFHGYEEIVERLRNDRPHSVCPHCAELTTRPATVALAEVGCSSWTGSTRTRRRRRSSPWSVPLRSELPPLKAGQS